MKPTKKSSQPEPAQSDRLLKSLLPVFPTRDSDLLTVKDFAHRPRDLQTNRLYAGLQRPRSPYPPQSASFVYQLVGVYRLAPRKYLDVLYSARYSSRLLSCSECRSYERSYRPPGRHFAPNGQSLATPFLRLQIRNTAHRTVDTVRLYFHAGCGSEIRPHNSKHQYETNEISHR